MFFYNFLLFYIFLNFNNFMKGIFVISGNIDIFW